MGESLCSALDLVIRTYKNIGTYLISRKGVQQDFQLRQAFRFYVTVIVCLVGEEGGDVSTRARQLNGKRAISAASLCRVSTRDDEDPRCPPSPKPSS